MTGDRFSKNFGKIIVSIMRPAIIGLGAFLCSNAIATFLQSKLTTGSEINYIDPGSYKVATRNLSRRGIPKYKCEEIYEDEIETQPESLAQKHDPLERFVEHLKSFVNETGFDVVAFDMHFSMLKDSLADINFSAHTQTLSSERSAQLKFAKHLFQVMEDASIDAKGSTMDSQSSADPVAYKSIVLNIRALVLHDMYGKPELQMRDYEKKVHELSSDIYDMRSNFENHITEAEITIESLVKQME